MIAIFLTNVSLKMNGFPVGDRLLLSKHLLFCSYVKKDHKSDSS